MIKLKMQTNLNPIFFAIFAAPDRYSTKNSNLSRGKYGEHNWPGSVGQKAAMKERR
jgi:hypothetical protein